jgi:hypothetical protein
MLRDFVDRSRLHKSGHFGQRAARSPDSLAKIQSDVESPARKIGPLQRARIGSGLASLAMAVALAGCWPLPPSTLSSSPPVEVSKPISGPQTADANDAVAERFPSLDPNGRIDEAPPSEAAKLEQELDLLRAVRPDQMPPIDTSRNGASPWPTAEPPPTATIPPEFKVAPAAPPSDETARTTNPAEDQTSSTMKASPQQQPPADEQGLRPDVEPAQRPKADESRSPKAEESRPPRAKESRPPKAEESQPSNAGERPKPKARERQRSRLAHRGRREPREDERPTLQATKNAETPHGLRSVRNARASMEKIAIPPAGQLVLPPGLRPTRPPL